MARSRVLRNSSPDTPSSWSSLTLSPIPSPKSISLLPLSIHAPPPIVIQRLRRRSSSSLSLPPPSHVAPLFRSLMNLATLPNPTNTKRIEYLSWSFKVSKNSMICFRCSFLHAEQYKSGCLPMLPPSKEYVKALVKGLVEGKQLTQEEAIEYINNATVNKL